MIGVHGGLIYPKNDGDEEGYNTSSSSSSSSLFDIIAVGRLNRFIQ